MSKHMLHFKFVLILEKEISVFSNGSYIGWRVGHHFESGPNKDHLSPIWFNSFREENFNVI